jgi:putative Ca2+/H+ antiporter (TMEM165/GDT1 family)
MNWKIFFATFGAVFLAELGDKTQLAGLNLAAKSKLPVVVFFGSVSAYAVVTLITIAIGDSLTRFFTPEHIRIGAASLFIIIGILMLAGKV